MRGLATISATTSMAGGPGVAQVDADLKSEAEVGCSTPVAAPPLSSFRPLRGEHTHSFNAMQPPQNVDANRNCFGDNSPAAVNDSSVAGASRTARASKTETKGKASASVDPVARADSHRGPDLTEAGTGPVSGEARAGTTGTNMSPPNSLAPTAATDVAANHELRPVTRRGDSPVVSMSLHVDEEAAGATSAVGGQANIERSRVNGTEDSLERGVVTPSSPKPSPATGNSAKRKKKGGDTPNRKKGKTVGGATHGLRGGGPAGGSNKKKQILVQYNYQDTKDAEILEEFETNKDRLYCICRKPYQANQFMVMCDLCREWYHLQCLKLASEPEGVWACTECARRLKEEDEKNGIKNKRFAHYQSMAIAKARALIDKNKKEGVQIRLCKYINCGKEFVPSVAGVTEFCSEDCETMYELQASGALPEDGGRSESEDEGDNVDEFEKEKEKRKATKQRDVKKDDGAKKKAAPAKAAKAAKKSVDAEYNAGSRAKTGATTTKKPTAKKQPSQPAAPVVVKPVDPEKRAVVKGKIADVLGGNRMIADLIEKEVFALYGQEKKEYVQTVLRITNNVRNPENTVLREKILSGKILPGRLVRMTPQELAPPKLQERAKQIHDKSKFMNTLTNEDIGPMKGVRKTHKGEEVLDDDQNKDDQLMGPSSISALEIPQASTSLEPESVTPVTTPKGSIDMLAKKSSSKKTAPVAVPKTKAPKPLLVKKKTSVTSNGIGSLLASITSVTEIAKQAKDTDDDDVDFMEGPASPDHNGPVDFMPFSPRAESPEKQQPAEVVPTDTAKNDDGESWAGHLCVDGVRYAVSASVLFGDQQTLARIGVTLQERSQVSRSEMKDLVAKATDSIYARTHDVSKDYSLVSFSPCLETDRPSYTALSRVLQDVAPCVCLVTHPGLSVYLFAATREVLGEEALTDSLSRKASIGKGDTVMGLMVQAKVVAPGSVNATPLHNNVTPQREMGGGDVNTGLSAPAVSSVSVDLLKMLQQTAMELPLGSGSVYRPQVDPGWDGQQQQPPPQQPQSMYGVQVPQQYPPQQSPQYPHRSPVNAYPQHSPGNQYRGNDYDRRQRRSRSPVRSPVRRRSRSPPRDAWRGPERYDYNRQGGTYRDSYRDDRDRRPAPRDDRHHRPHNDRPRDSGGRGYGRGAPQRNYGNAW